MIQTSNWLLVRTAGLFTLLSATLWLVVPEFPGPTYHYFRTQDLPTTLMILMAIVLTAFWWPKCKLPDHIPSTYAVLMLGALLTLMLWGGTHYLMLDYPLTRDEELVAFDAAIFESGKLAQPVDVEWRGYARALVPDWLLGVPDNELLVSHYLPGNSMMRLGFAAIADPALMNPLLSAIGFVVLYDIARRLFAETPAAVWIVLATYLLSAQVLVNAMTSYAMAGHLALNLIWLSLFLRGQWWQHVFAMAIGVWAIGLHQISYHPFFAAPFILMLLYQNKWRLFVAYALVYAGALLLWISYPSIILMLFEIVQSGGKSHGPTGFLTEVVWPRITRLGTFNIVIMEFNLLRFLVWSPTFLLPLLILAWPDVRRLDNVACPLFLGIVLTLVVRIVLQYYQGHGWGYRHFHGLMGNFALLAGYGYLHWARQNRERADGTVMLLGGATSFVILPFLLWSAHLFTAPYARLSAAIEMQPTDYVIVDTETSLAAIDQVRNRADLVNRPLVFASHRLSKAQLEELCARGSVTWVGTSDIEAANLPMPAVKLSVPRESSATLLEGCAKPFLPFPR